MCRVLPGKKPLSIIRVCEPRSELRQQFWYPGGGRERGQTQVENDQCYGISVALSPGLRKGFTAAVGGLGRNRKRRIRSESIFCAGRSWYSPYVQEEPARAPPSSPGAAVVATAGIGHKVLIHAWHSFPAYGAIQVCDVAPHGPQLPRLQTSRIGADIELSASSVRAPFGVTRAALSTGDREKTKFLL
jgi:hypothetical protein